MKPVMAPPRQRRKPLLNALGIIAPVAQLNALRQCGLLRFEIGFDLVGQDTEVLVARPIHIQDDASLSIVVGNQWRFIEAIINLGYILQRQTRSVLSRETTILEKSS